MDFSEDSLNDAFKQIVNDVDLNPEDFGSIRQSVNKQPTSRTEKEMDIKHIRSLRTRKILTTGSIAACLAVVAGMAVTQAGVFGPDRSNVSIASGAGNNNGASSTSSPNSQAKTSIVKSIDSSISDLDRGYWAVVHGGKNDREKLTLRYSKLDRTNPNDIGTKVTEIVLDLAGDIKLFYSPYDGSTYVCGARNPIVGEYLGRDCFKINSRHEVSTFAKHVVLSDVSLDRRYGLFSFRRAGLMGSERAELMALLQDKSTPDQLVANGELLTKQEALQLFERIQPANGSADEPVFVIRFDYLYDFATGNSLPIDSRFNSGPLPHPSLEDLKGNLESGKGYEIPVGKFTTDASSVVYMTETGANRITVNGDQLNYASIDTPKELLSNWREVRCQLEDNLRLADGSRSTRFFCFRADVSGALLSDLNSYELNNSSNRLEQFKWANGTSPENGMTEFGKVSPTGEYAIREIPRDGRVVCAAIGCALPLHYAVYKLSDPLKIVREFYLTREPGFGTEATREYFEFLDWAL